MLYAAGVDGDVERAGGGSVAGKGVGAGGGGRSPASGLIVEVTSPRSRVDIGNPRGVGRH